MAAVFIEGIIFLILAITGLRVKFAKLIPTRCTRAKMRRCARRL